jgi:hypothetical protein
MMRVFTVTPFAQGILHLSKPRAQSLHHDSSGSGADPDSVAVGDDALFSGLQGDFPGESRHGIVRRDPFTQLHGFAAAREGRGLDTPPWAAGEPLLRGGINCWQ